ncbi:MAG TPA: class I SAM-dependent methyltransferase [Vicinamibacterales bacterium]|nr:class I SAM-dependent methyltransferase [Vicinamibacterales bacterium]
MTDITQHYSRGDLLTRLNAALVADGADPARPTVEALAPYDQFHGRGLEATIELADQMPVRSTDRILDIGGGIGGPARYVATRFGCHVTGIDLTPEFVDVAQHLTRVMHLDARVTFEVGDATKTGFADASFDGAYSINVAMNIADKHGFYREIHRLLKPGGWVLLAEIAKAGGGAIDYPTPWASTAASSFLATADETQRALVECGFRVDRLQDSRDAALAYGARSRAMVERGGKPPHRAVALIHRDVAKAAMANSAAAMADGRIAPIDIFARKI